VALPSCSKLALSFCSVPKVENGVGYAQDNALKGRVFSSLEEQNSFLREWELMCVIKVIDAKSAIPEQHRLGYQENSPRRA